VLIFIPVRSHDRAWALGRGPIRKIRDSLPH